MLEPCMLKGILTVLRGESGGNTADLPDYNLLRKQTEPEAHHVATALEIYVTGSLNVFNHKTNVNISNRLICFDIKELGKQLKKLGMLILMDCVWNCVTVVFQPLPTSRNP